jgi:hypothetical protein
VGSDLPDVQAGSPQVPVGRTSYLRLRLDLGLNDEFPNG